MAKAKKKRLKEKKLRAALEIPSANKKNGRSLKVIHAPLNYAGQAYALSRALKAEGINSKFYRFKIAGQQGQDSGDVYGYKDDRVLEFTWANQFGDLIRCTQRIIDKKPDIVHLWHRTLIYGEHGTPFNGLDLPLLQKAGARIAFRFTGYELRRKSLEMQLNPYSPFHYGFEFGFSEDDQKRFYDFIRPYVGAFIVQDPEMQTYCPEAHIVPRVINLAKFPVVERTRNARPMVVHASTDDLLKGTRFVLKAVEELKDEGLDFDFRLIKDMPNSAALELYRKADIVIDQLLIGWYGVLAMETMAMGKAVIAYIRDDLTGYFGEEMPLLNANPDTIKDVLRTAIRDARLREMLGHRGRGFVETTHGSRVVARNLIKIYQEMLTAPVSFFPAWPEQIPEAWGADVGLAKIARQVPASNAGERERKLELLAAAGTVDEVERKLAAEPHLIDLMRRIPADSPKELERKITLLAQAGTLDDVERSLIFDANVMKLVRKVPAATPRELERKIEVLVKAGTLDEIEQKLGILSPAAADLLKLLRQIPAKTDEEREQKIAALIPKKERAAAVAEERRKHSDYGVFLVNLANRIPSANQAELEAKITALIPRAGRPAATRNRTSLLSDLVRVAARLAFNALGEWNRKKVNPTAATASSAGPLKPDNRIVVPTSFTASAAAFTAFEENLLKLLRRIPAKNAAALQKKVASLIAEKGRAAAIARARQHSADDDSFLVNLARHIPAADPPELEFKLSSLVPAEPVTVASDGRGSVCIVTRKPIRNVTRAPRMAKALSDAGYRVTVVSPAPPVDELRDMCPEVEYIVADYRAFTHDVIRRLDERGRERKTRRDERERDYRVALAKGGWSAFRHRSWRALTRMAPIRAIRRLSWQALVVAPSARLLKAETQSYAEMRQDLDERDAIGIAVKYVWTLSQWASSHAFAGNADQLTAGRHFDVVQAYDNYGLVAGARLAARTGAKLIYDAVEIATDRVAQDLSKLEKVREHLERREEAAIFLKADRMLGTGDALAGWYAKRYRMPKPLVMRNCRYYWPYRQDGRLRADIGAGPDTRVLLWCGGAYPQQGIELAIRMLPHLPTHIHLAIVTDIADMWRKYITEELPAIALSFGVDDRVHILPERSPNDLVPYISDGDIGFVLSIPVNHPNQYYNLPNKFFEYIMARLPVGTLAFPEVVNIVNKHEIGRVLDEHDSARNAATVQEMLEPARYAQLKANVMKAAEVLCWENESKPYVRLVDSLMPAPYREHAFASRRVIERGSAMPGMALPVLAPSAGGN